MLLPKKIKYRKQIIRSKKGISLRGFNVNFGEYGLKAMSSGLLTSRQIEAARKSITGVTKRNGKLWIMVFPAVPITKKPLEVRMGKGVGAIDHYSAVVKTGKIIFELTGVDVTTAKEAFRRASMKLPIRTRFVNVSKE